MSRIKMFVALPMAAGVTTQFFHDHWRHPHGTWGAMISCVQHYVQSHRIDTAFLEPDQARYEGVVEVWLEGVADCIGLPNHPDYLRYLAPDEPRFIDMQAIRYVFMDEEIIQSGPPPQERLGDAGFAWREDKRPLSVKLIQIIEQEGATPWAMDEDLVLGAKLGALRHVRCRPNAVLHPRRPSSAAVTDTGIVGIRELWWATYSDFETAVGNARAEWNTLLARPRMANTALYLAERYG